MTGGIVVDTLTLPPTEEQKRAEVRRSLPPMLRRLEHLAARTDLPADLAGAAELARQAIEELWRIAGGPAEAVAMIAEQEWRSRRHG